MIHNTQSAQISLYIMPIKYIIKCITYLQGTNPWIKITLEKLRKITSTKTMECFALYRSSCLQMFFKMVFLKVNKFHRKNPVWESLYNKSASLHACTFIKKRLQLKCFPVKFVIFLRTPFLPNLFGGLPLTITQTDMFIKRQAFTDFVTFNTFTEPSNTKDWCIAKSNILYDC